MGNEYHVLHRGEADMSWPRLLAPKYDRLFKHIISAGWNVKSDGDVEAPTGFFALVEVPSDEGERLHMIEELQAGLSIKLFDYLAQENWPDPGWYVTSENSDGLIFVGEFPTKKDAERAYYELMQAFIDWSDAGNLP